MEYCKNFSKQENELKQIFLTGLFVLIKFYIYIYIYIYIG